MRRSTGVTPATCRSRRRRAIERGRRHGAGPAGTDPQQASELGSVVDQFVVSGLDRFQQRHDGLAGVRLEWAVLVVLFGKPVGISAGGGRQDVEQAADAGLGLDVVEHFAVGVGDGPLELLDDRFRVVEHHDAAGVAVGRLRHLRGWVLEVHDAGTGLGGDGFRDHERVAESVVEPDRDITGDLDVLTLIVADRDLVGAVQHDVGRLQGRIGEQAGRDEVALALGGLLFELGHPAQFAERHRALHHPTELRVFGDVALHEHGCHLGVEPDRKQHRRQVQRGFTEYAWLLGDRERVQVDDAVKDVLVVLVGHPVAKRTEVIAQVDVAGRLDTGKHSSHDLRGYLACPITPVGVSGS